MARMYFNFEMNVKREDDEYNPQVNYIAFEDDCGNTISVACNWESDYGLGDDGMYSARFKGLEVSVNDDEWHDMKLQDFNELKGMKPYKIGIYFSEEQEYQLIDNQAQNVEVSIEYYEVDKDKTHTCSFQEESASLIED